LCGKVVQKSRIEILKPWEVGTREGHEAVEKVGVNICTEYHSWRSEGGGKTILIFFPGGVAESSFKGGKGGKESVFHLRRFPSDEREPACRDKCINVNVHRGREKPSVEKERGIDTNDILGGVPRPVYKTFPHGGGE